jgi:hypothetical protein
MLGCQTFDQIRTSKKVKNLRKKFIAKLDQKIFAGCHWDIQGDQRE